MSFQISDKVVCVDDDYPHWAPLAHSRLPIKGEVFVIRDIYTCKQGMGLRLFGSIGLHNPNIPGEHGFNPTRFRKLSEIQAENKAKWEQEQENQQYYELLK